MELAKSLINLLEIGSLNSIEALANSITAHFDHFLGKYPNIIAQLFEFRTLVEGDFYQLFTFPEKIHALKI